MSVLLVNPIWSERPSDSDVYMYPYSLVYLQNHLLKNGVPCTIFDLFYKGHAEALRKACLDDSSPIVGVTSQTTNRYNALSVIKGIRDSAPGATIVVGGKHFGQCAEETLEWIPEIDIVVRGEGEHSFHETVKALMEGKSLEGIEGISYRRNGGVVRNRSRSLEKDLDRFTLDYELLPPLGDFGRGIYLKNFENERLYSLPLLLGRGCNQHCIFCSYMLMGHRVRSLESVMDELIYLKDRYKQSCFTFSDPSFAARKDFAEAFCEELLSRDLGIKWSCEARADTPLPLLRLMARAGCVSLDFAIESGSPRIIEVIRKEIGLEQAVDFARECQKLDIRSLVFFMVSHPEETVEDAEKTLEVAESLSEYTQYVTFNVTQILPGTQLERIARRKGILPADFTWFDPRFNHAHADLAPPQNPLYLENLSVDYVRGWMKRASRLRAQKYTRYSDLLRMARKGLHRIPNQSLGTTLKETARFVSIAGRKLAPHK